ncbi:methyltransferase domain-containing protein [Streptomyces albus subsp. chlorinus]|uniref:class I SAM-dependent methyltransferase n=1 Tax=Streptomyces albus TaxID=1888 RepID=UPI00156F1CD4|nr:class I SAM-dependent methyltransferase [Streptomyces albus]NSC19716.1 methyltransferase domain-containing protein [Streptomyces albus subsp. chlorinus]
MSHYVFDNSAEETNSRFGALEATYDPASRAALARTGVGSGWTCLEVGGGGGSLGRWLGERVGPTGRVSVTDVEPRWMDSREKPGNVRLLRHDIAHDSLPEDEFDLIHARLVLVHVPERRQVLLRLVQALRPGGWLVLEEFDCGWIPVLTAPSCAATDLFTRVHAELMSLMESAGGDPLWGRKVVQAMADAGLEQMSTTVFAQAWSGKSAGIDLHRANTEQLRDELLAAGLSERELHAFWDLLQNPAFAVTSYPLLSAAGKRCAA